MTADECIGVGGEQRACTAGENVTLGQEYGGAGSWGSCCFLGPGVCARVRWSVWF